ncbi:MAG: hypothetical protein Q9M19_04185 [Mariprofundaceae bacterium]|nr:hypothetical protein [Mariprofundaceae bacterium]
MMRLVFSLVMMLVLSSCSGDSTESNTSTAGNTTQVTISLADVMATGALQGTGNVPTNVQSMSVQVFSATGVSVLGPVVANLPNLSLTLNVANGNGLKFRVLAFDLPSAQGATLYEGQSTADLTGAAITVPVTMNLAIVITGDVTSVVRAGVVNLTVLVGGVAPTASSPILWTASVGSVVANVWTAPNIVGLQTLTAQIDPAVNPDQDPNIVGTFQVNVVNQAPVLTLSATNITVTEGVTNTSITAMATDADVMDSVTYALPAAAPTWASIQATTGVLTLTPTLNDAGSYTLTVLAMIAWVWQRTA